MHNHYYNFRQNEKSREKIKPPSRNTNYLYYSAQVEFETLWTRVHVNAYTTQYSEWGLRIRNLPSTVPTKEVKI